MVCASPLPVTLTTAKPDRRSCQLEPIVARRKTKPAKSRKEPELSARSTGKAKSAAPKVSATNSSGSAAPKGDNKAARKVLGARKGFARRAMRWTFRAGLLAIFFFVALFVSVTFSYKPSAVHPVSTLMIWNKIKGETVTRDWVALSDISPNVWQSVVSSEDGQFCRHHGVDWAEIDLVIDDALEGEPVRGASTIAMQSVKNLYLWPSRSYIRKVLEVPLAMLVDAVWGKKRLMEIYLNIAEWGPGIYGIEAAAQHHFGRPASKLSRRQAALLAVTLPNPKLRNPAKPGKGMRRIARLVERRAKASGAYVGCLR